MSSRHLLTPERCTMMERKVPSLVDMCIQLAVDNIRHLGDVGDTGLDLLERILPHCTVDQLKHIEDLTEVRGPIFYISFLTWCISVRIFYLISSWVLQERDLSPVTDKLWKKFYERQFGANSTNLVCERMTQKKVLFKWKLLYEVRHILLHFISTMISLVSIIVIGSASLG